jgi:hypothetical protein
MRNFFAVAMGSVVALVGFAGAANASATVDLIWIDITDTACTNVNRRDCPQLGTTLSSVAVTDNITLVVLLTAGPGGVVGAGVSVDYSNVLPFFNVIGFRNFTTQLPEPWLIGRLGVTSDMPPFIDNFSAVSLPWASNGLGLPAGASAYLGTVSFHIDQLESGIFEIDVGAFGPAGTDGIGDLAGQNITSTTTFNSAFVVDPEPTATPTATPTPAICSPAGTSCQKNSDCCSNQCSGSGGNKVCQPAPTPTASPTATPSATPTPTPTVAVTPTGTPSATPTPTPTPEPSASTALGPAIALLALLYRRRRHPRGR